MQTAVDLALKKGGWRGYETALKDTSLPAHLG